jgi:hypothetical protein
MSLSLTSGIWTTGGKNRTGRGDRRDIARGSGLWRGDGASDTGNPDRGSGGSAGDTTNDLARLPRRLIAVEGYRPAGDLLAYGRRGCPVSDRLWRRNRTFRGRLGVGRGAAPPDGGDRPAPAKASTAPALAHTIGWSGAPRSAARGNGRPSSKPHHREAPSKTIAAGRIGDACQP